MFQTRLQALEHPDPAAVNAENRKVFANTVLWLEDQVIRFYTIEDRADLRNIGNIKLWEEAYQRYKKDLCVPKFNSATEELFWLLSYGVRLSFLDSPEKFDNISSSQVEFKEGLSLNGEESHEKQSGLVEVRQESIHSLADSEVEDILNSIMEGKPVKEKKGGLRRAAQKANGGPKRKRFSIENKFLYPGWGKPGGLDDRYIRGLSGAGKKWYMRFIAQGHTAKDARKMVDKRRTKNKFVFPDEIIGEIIESKEQHQSRIKLEDPIEGHKREHSPETYDPKRSKTSASKDYPISDPFKKGLSGAGKKWYMRFIESGIEPSVARQMAEQRRSKPDATVPIEYKSKSKGPNEVELLVLDRGSKGGIISKSNWRHLKIRLVTAFVSLLKEFPGPIPAYRDSKTSIVNGRPIICEDKRSADLFQLAILQMGRLWPRAQLEAFPTYKNISVENPTWA